MNVVDTMIEAGCNKLVLNPNLPPDKCWQALGHPTLSFCRADVNDAIDKGDLTKEGRQVKIALTYMKARADEARKAKSDTVIRGTTSKMSSGALYAYLPTVYIGSKRYVPKGRSGQTNQRRVRAIAVDWADRIRKGTATVEEFVNAF